MPILPPAPFPTDTCDVQTALLSFPYQLTSSRLSQRKSEGWGRGDVGVFTLFSLGFGAVFHGCLWFQLPPGSSAMAPVSAWWSRRLSCPPPAPAVTDLCLILSLVLQLFQPFGHEFSYYFPFVNYLTWALSSCLYPDLFKG